MTPNSIDAAEVHRRERLRFTPGLALSHRFGGGVEVSADGAWVCTSEGRRLLDFGSYGVTLLGHRHPQVVEAVSAQLATLPTSTRGLANLAAVECADAVVDYLNEPSLSRVWLALNGADAVEASLKLAALATGRSAVIAVDGAYHGKSMGALSVTHASRYRTLVPIAWNTVFLDPNDPNAMAHAFENCAPGALIFEPILGEGGVRSLPPTTLRAWCEQARDAGVFVIADEIQVGLGRAGPRSVALDLGLRPDAILLGKSLGGGVVPLSAVVGTDEFFAALIDDPFIHTATFASHPLSAAAGVAALGALRQLESTAKSLASKLGTMFVEAFAESPLVTELRGQGFFYGVECSSPREAGVLLSSRTDESLLVSPCLSAPTIVRLMPPLILTDIEAAAATRILERAVQAAESTIARYDDPPSSEDSQIPSRRFSN